MRFSGAQSRHRVGAVDVLNVLKRDGGKGAEWPSHMSHAGNAWGNGASRVKGTSSAAAHRERVRPAAKRAEAPQRLSRHVQQSTMWPVMTVACDQCSATLPLCAQLRHANSAQISEEATMSENAEQKTGKGEGG